MGCVSSKQAVVSVTPALDHSGQFKADANAASRRTNSGRAKQENKNKKKKKDDELAVGSGRGMSGGGEVEPSSFRLGNLQKYIEGEQVAAGWPAWLSSVAAEAIQGWVPLRADSYEKLEKIGQGTYSSVFRARDLDTGKIVALKKVRFDNFEPESVRFMAREIMILRRLDHPNVMKLEGLITSRLSCSIFLVFEYMEHDITGLLSCPDVKFTEAQIKCYMKQLLSGLDHCHTRSVMHRDIKGSNLLVNNEGVLKVADFGLANFCSSKQPLTSRVVTLWYRPPELLLGATDYGTSVDLWSVGSVFAEILTGKPVLQGRTEVEQLHKIFKLCGSPPEEYWKRSRLPHSTIFKPNQPYESCLREKFKDFPTTAVDLLETLLSVEPHKRCTASSALASEYFNSSPYACDPSSLPRYPPSKEIDAKNRDGAGRKKNIGARTRDNPKKPSGNPHGINKLAPLEEISQPRNTETNQKACSNVPTHVMEVKRTTSRTEAPKGDNNNNTSSQLKSNVDVVPFSGPSEVSSSSGFAWAKKREDVSTSFLPRYHSRSISKSHIFNPMEQPNSGKTNNSNNTSRGGYDFFEDTATKRKQRRVPPFGRPESFDASDYEYHSQELLGLYQKEGPVADNRTHGFLGYSVKANQVDFSGPLLSQKHGVDELLEKHERHIRQATRKSWFQRAKKEEK